MHFLLKRQLKKSGLVIPDDTNSPLLDFINRIDQSYLEADESRYTLERSLELLSAEMKITYEQHCNSFKLRQDSILNALPDLLFLLDEEGRYLEILASEKSEDLYLPEDKLIGCLIADILPPSEANIFIKTITKAIETSELQIIHYVLDLLSGETHFEGRVIATGQEVNGKKTVIFLARDITKDHMAKQQSVLLHTVLESATEGMVIVRNDKKVLYANPAIEKLTGFTPDELLHSGEGFLRHELDSILCEELCHLATVGDHFQKEIQIHNKHGGKTIVLLTMDTIRDEKGEIENFIGILTDFTEIKQTHERLEYIATHDVLTNLPNRLMFEERLKQAISKSVRKGKLSALLFLDLDRFKNINDSLGHGVGDELLKQIATRLLSVSREEDTVSRFGGDEFIILLEDIETKAHALRSADKILNVFQEQFHLQGYEFDMSTSIGITLFPENGKEVEQLIKQADTAMYAAKENGRNRYHLFSHELSEDVIDSFKLEIEMRKALENEDFFLVYQPQYTLKDGSLSGFEALIRWDHPNRGLILPLDFIPAAETTGLINDIGLWVFKQVCLCTVDWMQRGLNPKCVSFNLSARQLMDEHLIEKIMFVLNETGAIKYIKNLECEITESAIIKQTDIAYHNLFDISELGIKLAIDDFGTGHSSLVNLKRLPLNRLKIDQCFVREIGLDSTDEAIISASIALAGSFALDVVAEGVENSLQESFLKELGCEQVQGYYYNKPLSSEEAEKIM